LITVESVKLAPTSWIVSIVKERIIAPFVKIKTISTHNQLMAVVSANSHFGSMIINV
jgi:hypothetical protein